MNQDDLPLHKWQPSENTLAGELGWRLGNFTIIAVIFGVIGAVLYLVAHWH